MKEKGGGEKSDAQVKGFESRGAAAPTENIVRIPVQEIQIVVVQKLGGIQDAFRGLGDVPPTPGFAPRTRVVAVGHVQQTKTVSALAQQIRRRGGGCGRGGRGTRADGQHPIV